VFDLSRLAATAAMVAHHPHLHVAFHVHRHGSPVGYAGLALAAFVGWTGIPGAGEAALITAAVFATRGKLDLGLVEIVALVAATAGGVVGWVVGKRVGNTVAAAPGPLYRLRRRGLRAGERFFERFGVLAVFLVPSWVAGINNVRTSLYLPANAIAALVWALLYGVGAYVLGPQIGELASDIGLAGLAVIVAVALVAGGAALLRARRA
jgi:membrane protein DedA with SNARE-associated domain